jgi:hypothetical protein
MVPGFEDDKGKIFTEVVKKYPVSVTVQTVTHTVRGKIHIRPDERLKAELDRDEPFLAMTDAAILDASGATLQRADFLAVRRDQIIWVLPEEGDQ